GVTIDLVISQVGADEVEGLHVGRDGEAYLVAVAVLRLHAEGVAPGAVGCGVGNHLAAEDQVHSHPRHAGFAFVLLGVAVEVIPDQVTDQYLAGLSGRAIASLLVTQDSVYIDLWVAAIELGVETGVAIANPPFADPGSPLQTCGRAGGGRRELRDG